MVTSPPHFCSWQNSVGLQSPPEGRPAGSIDYAAQQRHSATARKTDSEVQFVCKGKIMNARASRATMTDVAREAGVSASTASRVVYNNGYVSEENRARVLAAVEKVGYRPNIQARSLRNQRSYTLGLVIDSATNNAHFAHISHAMRMEAAAAGYSLLTVDHEYNVDLERDGLKHLLDHNVEAIVVCHPFILENYDIVRDAGIPLIQIERDNLGDVHRVGIDPTPGIEEAVRHLVRFGHRSIGYVSGTSTREAGPHRNSSVEECRIASFTKALLQHDVDHKHCTIRTVPYDLVIPNAPLHGYTLGIELLSRPHYPTALIVGADVLAAGILQAAQELNIAVPQRLSLIGFDDSIARFLAPPLATIVQPYTDIARHVLDITSGLGTPTPGSLQQRIAKTHFLPRRSTGTVAL
jgi:LacI family transcriptional regulator